MNWERDGEELKAWADPLYGNSGWSRIIKSVGFYFRPGLTWPRRTQLGLNLRAYPAGAIFADKGPVAFAHPQHLPLYLGLSNSSAFATVISLQMAFGSYEVGVIQRTPVPDLSNVDGEHVGELARSAVVRKQSLDTVNETSHVFMLPAVLQVPGNTLIERVEGWRVRVADAAGELASLQQHLDEVSYRLYGIAGEDRQAVQVSPDEEVTTEDAEAEEDDTSIEEEGASATNSRTLISDLLSYALGTTLGQWDIRYATSQSPCPELPDPFAPLPVCSPGMLTGEGGIPLHEAPLDILSVSTRTACW